MKKWCLSNLDKYLDWCIYRDLICETRQIARQLYLSRITKFRFPDLIFTHIQVICVGFLFSQPWTYIRIILRAIKGDVTWFKVIIHSNCDQRQFALVYLSLKEAIVFVRQRFCNQCAPWSSSSGWIEELCSQHLSQVGILVTYWDPCIDWLVTYLEPCIERRDCHYITSPIVY